MHDHILTHIKQSRLNIYLPDLDEVIIYLQFVVTTQVREMSVQASVQHIICSFTADTPPVVA